MKKAFSVFSAVEWVVIVAASTIIFFVAQKTQSPYREILFALPGGIVVFFKQTKYQKTDREQIVSKGFQRKSQEQIRDEKLAQRRAEYDRDLANRMRAKGMARSAAPKTQDSAKYKKLLTMLNGDRATADRLVAAYGVDRAISDLERDRR